MKITFDIRAGIGKASCEDTAFDHVSIVNGTMNENQVENLVVVGIADGVGGNAGGKEASQYLSSRVCRMDFSDFSQEQICEFFCNINQELILYASRLGEKAHMASTMTCLVRGKDGYYLVHAGNTRLYAKQGEYLKQLSFDHTTYNWLCSLQQYEAAESCNKYEINCCFGGGDNGYLRTLVVEKVFQMGIPDLIMLTSDGIHEYVDIDTLEMLINSQGNDREIAAAIIDKAQTNGSLDDASIVIVRNEFQK